MRRLKDEMGVAVTYTHLPADQLVIYDDNSGVLQLRATAPLHQQLFALTQIWYLNSFGPWAAPAARQQRHLRLVPQPIAGA